MFALFFIENRFGRSFSCGGFCQPNSKLCDVQPREGRMKEIGGEVFFHQLPKRVAAYGLLLLCTLSLVICSCATDSPSKSSTGPFQAKYVPSLQEPEVVVLNQTQKIITLDLKGPQSYVLTISPNSSQTVKVPPGTYNYHASAPEVVPASGSASFETQHRYTWTFIIKTSK
jgi:hypothetical protein